MTDPTWLSRVNPAGNWTGRAHLFADRDTRRARCGMVRMDDEWWEPAPHPVALVACKRCELLNRGNDGGA